jgi:hypothetical protein
MRKIIKQKKMKNLFLFLALLFCCDFSFADWQKIPGASTSDGVHYVDLESLKLTEDGKWRVWQLINFNVPKQTTNGSLAKSQKIYFEIECSDFKIKVLTGTTFAGEMGNGEVLGSTKSSGDYNFIAPGSIGSAIATPLCSNLK